MQSSWFVSLLRGVVLASALGGGCQVSCGNPSSAPSAAAVAPQIAGPFTSAASETALPPTVNPIPASTPELHFAWVHPSLTQGEQVSFSLVAVDVGAAAPAGTVVTSTQMNAPAAGANHGNIHFSMPTAWPPGRYRVVGTAAAAGALPPLEFVIQ